MFRALPIRRTTGARFSPAGPQKWEEHLKSCCKYATATPRECKNLNLKGRDAQRRVELASVNEVTRRNSRRDLRMSSRVQQTSLRECKGAKRYGVR